MSLSLASKPVSAAISPTLSINFLTRTHASCHGVADTVGVVNLPLTVTFLGQEVTTSFPFTLINTTLGFNVLLGAKWESWCARNKG